MKKQFIVVGLGSERYGIAIENVLNIIRMLDITRVPAAPPSVRGVVNLRGEILPVMSLRQEFGLEKIDQGKKARILFVKVDEAPIGLIVDRVYEVVDLDKSDLEQFEDDSLEGKKPYIWGIGKIEGDLIALLDLEELVRAAIGSPAIERKGMNG